MKFTACYILAKVYYFSVTLQTPSSSLQSDEICKPSPSRGYDIRT